jgi:hypothetical protein
METNIVWVVAAATAFILIVYIALRLWRLKTDASVGAELTTALERLERTFQEDQRGTRQEIADFVGRQGRAVLDGQSMLGEVQRQQLERVERETVALGQRVSTDGTQLRTEVTRVFEHQRLVCRVIGRPASMRLRSCNHATMIQPAPNLLIANVLLGSQAGAGDELRSSDDVR